MIFYFTATGNSLYVAKQLDTNLVSIPQAIHHTDQHYKADSIGVVFGGYIGERCFKVKAMKHGGHRRKGANNEKALLVS